MQKAWEIAKGPIKQLPMNIFMMWMAGNTVHIFSLMMVFMMVMNPIKALSNVSVGMLPSLAHFMATQVHHDTYRPSSVRNPGDGLRH